MDDLAPTFYKGGHHSQLSRWERIWPPHLVQLGKLQKDGIHILVTLGTYDISRKAERY